MKITVTAEDIKNGAKRDCRLCPIATAIRRVAGDDYKVGVRDVYDGSNRNYRVLPWAAMEFIQHFDNERKVYPFEFEMDLPEAA